MVFFPETADRKEVKLFLNISVFNRESGPSNLPLGLWSQVSFNARC